MRADARQFPETLDGERPIGYWSGHCLFRGSVSPAGHTLKSGDLRRGKFEGVGALAVCRERLIAIVSPVSPSAPALWWSWSLSSIEIDAAGGGGTVRAQPGGITLRRGGGDEANGETVVVSFVSSLDPHSGHSEDAQEASLLGALAGGDPSPEGSA
jgi:hypothetical protein